MDVSYRDRFVPYPLDNSFTPTPTPNSVVNYEVPQKNANDSIEKEIETLQNRIKELQQTLSQNKKNVEPQQQAKIDVEPEVVKIPISTVLVKTVKACTFALFLWGICFAYAAIGGAILVPLEKDLWRNLGNDANAALVPLNLTNDQRDLFCSLGACGDPDVQIGGWWLATQFMGISMVNIAKGAPPMIHAAPSRTFTVFWSMVGIPLNMVLFLVAANKIVKVIVLWKAFLTGSLSAHKRSQKDLLELFDNFDEDKDGVLDLIELQGFLTEISDGEKPEWDDLKAILDEVDTDKTKTIDREEYMKVVTLWTNYLNNAGKPPDMNLLIYCVLLYIAWCFIAGGIEMALEKDKDWCYGKGLFFAWMVSLGSNPGYYASNTGHQVFYLMSGYIGMGLLAIIGNVVVDMVIANANSKQRRLKSQLDEKKKLEEGGGSRGKALRRKALQSTWQFFLALCIEMGFFGLCGVILQAFELHPHKVSLQAGYDAVNSDLITDDQRQFILDNGLLPDPSKSYWTWIGTTWYLYTVYSTEGYGSFAPSTSGGMLFISIMTIPGFILAMHGFYMISEVVTAYVAWFLYYARGEHKKDQQKQSKFDMSFKAIDTDGSGMIDQSELKKLLESLTDNPIDDTDVTYVFQTADTDKSGQLAYNEVLVAVLLWNNKVSSLDLGLHWAIVIISLVLILGTFFLFSYIYKVIEDWDFMDACWFNYTSMMMMGYGDWWPRRRGGQIFNIFAIKFDWGLFVVMIQSLWKIIENRIKDHLLEKQLGEKS